LRKLQQIRMSVGTAIEKYLDDRLPPVCDEELYEGKMERVYHRQQTSAEIPFKVVS